MKALLKYAASASVSVVADACGAAQSMSGVGGALAD